MTFLFAALFLSLLHFIASLSAIAQRRMALALVNNAIAVAGGIAAVTGLTDLPAGPQQSGGPNHSIEYLLFFGGSALLVAGTGLVSMWRAGGDRSKLAWRSGLRVWALLASVYLCASVADHIRFVRGGNLVIADAQALRAVDVACQGLLIATLRDGAPSPYRCAHGPVWGVISGAPFLPWPSYSSGESAQLRAKIDEVSRRACARAPQPGCARANSPAG